MSGHMPSIISALASRVTLPEKLFIRLSELKDVNAHGDSYQEAATALGLTHLAEQFSRINSGQLHQGHLTHGLATKRQKAHEQLLQEAKHLLSETQYNQLYMCF